MKPAILSWGILATGGIANTFARGVAASQTGRLAAVGSRTPESAARFAREHGVPLAHGSYEALLADPEVQAVYVSPPHPFHAEWAIRAAAAGKHVLCEKPLAMNRAGAERIVAAAQTHGVLLMEAFMYRCHPQTAKVVELVRNGSLGRVGLVQAAFSFHAAFKPEGRHWGKALGGGGILDVGCYPVSLARLIAGAVDGRPFADPVSITGAGRLHPQTGVDAYAAATLKFGGGMIAQVSCGVGLQQDNAARIYGDQGWLLVPEPWVPAREGGTVQILLNRAGAAPQEISISAPPLYAIEADTFAAALFAGAKSVPAMTPEDTLGNMTVLDAWRAAIGLAYDADRV